MSETQMSTSRTAAQARADAYRVRADDMRAQADAMSLEQRKAVLLAAAGRFDELAGSEQALATGERRFLRNDPIAAT